jgi:hypothetical protein
LGIISYGGDCVDSWRSKVLLGVEFYVANNGMIVNGDVVDRGVVGGGVVDGGIVDGVVGVKPVLNALTLVCVEQ